MRAFDRIKSGIPDLDRDLDNIRLGDNVVWHVSDLNEFKLFVDPFIKQALKDQRNLIYIRFANHDPFIDITPEEQKILDQKDPNKPEAYTMVKRESGLKIYQVDPSTQFEAFTVAVHNIIAKEGRFSFCTHNLTEIENGMKVLKEALKVYKK